MTLRNDLHAELVHGSRYDMGLHGKVVTAPIPQTVKNTGTRAVEALGEEQINSTGALRAGESGPRRGMYEPPVGCGPRKKPLAMGIGAMVPSGMAGVEITHDDGLALRNGVDFGKAVVEDRLRNLRSDVDGGDTSVPNEYGQYLELGLGMLEHNRVANEGVKLDGDSTLAAPAVVGLVDGHGLVKVTSRNEVGGPEPSLADPKEVDFGRKSGNVMLFASDAMSIEGSKREMLGGLQHDIRSGPRITAGWNDCGVEQVL